MPFVVGPGFSPIPEKLVIKIKSGQFVHMADLLGDKKGYKKPPTLSHGWKHSLSTSEFTATHILLDGRT